MNSSVNRSYVAVLAIIAITILVVGAWLKPHDGKPEPLSETETATLQARVQRNSLDRSAAFFSQTAQELAAYVYYRPERKASGVAWKKNQLLSSTFSRNQELAPLALEQFPTDAPSIRTAEQISGDWLMVVAKTADGPVWFPVVSGGTRSASCAGRAYSEIVVNGNVASAPAGAGVFDLDKRLVGVVLRCDGKHIASTASVAGLVQYFDSASFRAGANGMQAEPLPSELQPLFAPATGLLITEVLDDSPAQRAHLRAGDLVTAAGDHPVATTDDLAPWLAETAARSSLHVIRQGKPLTLPAPDAANASEAANWGMQMAPPVNDGPALSITPGGAADRAGLKSGDVLLQVDAQPVRSKQTWDHLVAKAGNQSRLVIYRRGNSERAAVLKP